MKRVVFLLLVVVMVMVGALGACEATTPVDEEPPVDEKPPRVVAEPLPVIEVLTIPGAMPPIQFKISDTYIQLIVDVRDIAVYRSDLLTPQFSPWTITLVQGSTIPFIVNASVITSTDHTFTIEGTDIDVTLGPGEAAGPFEVTFDELGTFKVYCRHHPDEHGECLIVVEEPLPEGALPPIKLMVTTAGIQVQGLDLAAAFGEGFTDEQYPPWTITIPKGSTITIEECKVSGRPGTGDHSIAIEGTTLDVPVGEGGIVAGPWEITFNEVGTFKVYCSLHADEVYESLIVVTD